MFNSWKSDGTMDTGAGANVLQTAVSGGPVASALQTIQRNASLAAGAPAGNYSIINEWLTMRGDLESEGDILVKGKVYGNIRCKMLIADLGALIEGGVEAEELVVRGTLRGTIKVKRIRLEKSAVVDGEIHHDTFSAEEGARIIGTLKANEPVAGTLHPLPVRAAQAQTTHEKKVTSALYQILDEARSSGPHRPAAAE